MVPACGSAGYTTHDQAGCEKMKQEKIITEPLLENILKPKNDASFNSCVR
jgi:hypothetical protein